MGYVYRLDLHNNLSNFIKVDEKYIIYVYVHTFV